MYKQRAHYKPTLLLTHASTKLVVMLHIALPLGCKWLAVTNSKYGDVYDMHSCLS